MVFTRQKSITGANPESSPRTQPGTNIREIRTPSWRVFKQEHNEIFIQLVVQYSQEEKGDELHYLVLGLNGSSTDNDMEKPIVPWIFDFHPDKNQHSQVSDVMKMINEAK